MKKYLIILGILTSVILNAQVFDLRTYKPISENYRFSGDTLFTAYQIAINTNKYSSLTGAKTIVYSGGRGKVISISGPGDFELIGVEIYSTQGQAICAVLIQDSGNVVIDKCNLHHCEWGIRAFNGFNSSITVRNSWIHDTRDDGIYAENTNDWEICYNTIERVNQAYFTNDPGGGDCIQIAYRQRFLNIHHNYLDHSDVGNKFCVIVGSTNYPEALLSYHDNILIGRSYADKLREDPTTHTIESNSCMYLKSINSGIYNNIFINGMNAIFQGGSPVVYFKAWNNMFIGQYECLSLSGTWLNEISNNTFKNGIKSYFKGSAVGDSIYNNKLDLNRITESSCRNLYANQPAYWTYSKTDRFGFGCSKALELRAITETVIDTVPYYDSIPVEKIVKVPVYDTIGTAAAIRDYFNNAKINIQIK